MPGTQKLYWWKCQIGHSYQATPNTRTSKNSGCPYCNGRAVLVGFNDLASTNPELLQEWDYDKNTILPNAITSKSTSKVWWKCKNGHSFQATPNARTTKKSKCPYCTDRRILVGFNDLKSQRPDWAAEWDYDKNAPSIPEEYTIHSSKKVWWICSRCGASWQTRIDYRTRNGSGCIKCAHKTISEKRSLAAVKKHNLAERFPELAAEWHPTKNGELRPENVSYGNDDKAWWICPVCGYEYEKRIADRTTKGQGCPACIQKGTSFPEQAVFYYTSKVFPDTIYRHSYGRYELDIYIPSINTAIEYDGGIWHSNLERDNRKDNYCKKKGIRLFRIRDVALPKTDYAITINCCDNKAAIELSIKQVLDILLGDCPVSVNLTRDELEIRAMYKRYFRENSLATKYPEIAKEFASDLNHGLTAENVSWGTSTQYWWRCSKCGYEWKTTPNNRTRPVQPTGCPRCAIDKTGKKNTTRVINLDTGVVYESVTAAAESCGVTKGEITCHCQGKRGLTAGYHWAYYDEHQPRRKDYSGKVINLDTKEVFETPNDAAKSCNGDRRNIVQCCYGKTKTSYGYHWAIYNDDDKLSQ